jgi:hypothetical protein
MSHGSLHLGARSAHEAKRCIAVARIGALVALIVSAAFVAPAAPEVSGTMLNPFVGAVSLGNPAGQTINFAGFLFMPPDAGVERVDIDVMEKPDGDPNVEANWAYGVAMAPLIPIGGNAYFWTVDAAVFDEKRWPSGGLGRVRAVWVKPDDWGVLTAVDTLSTPLQINHAIVTDGDPTPAEVHPPRYLNALDNRREFPHFDDPTAQQKETEAYYAGIGTDPQGRGPNVHAAIPTLARFRERYFTGRIEYVARYYNRGDLGIGREMHCVFGGENACYVTNYAPIVGGRLIFGNPEGVFVNGRPPNPEGSFAAMARGQAFATVAMVERQGMAKDAPNKVFFVVYDAAGNLKSDNAQLDNQGHNTFIPGNCMVCHGGSGSYDPVTKAVTGAYFLPFDLAAFDFASPNPNNPLSREAQHDTFRAMNREIYSTTDTGLLPNAVIIKYWYQNDFNTGQFDGDAIPPFGGWDSGASQQRLYRRVFAPGCRTCHISHDARPDTFPFFEYAAFEANKNLISGVVCLGAPHRMPNAEQTLREFWRGDGRAHLFGHLPGLTGACRP